MRSRGGFIVGEEATGEEGKGTVGEEGDSGSGEEKKLVEAFEVTLVNERGGIILKKREGKIGERDEREREEVSCSLRVEFVMVELLPSHLSFISIRSWHLTQGSPEIFLPFLCGLNELERGKESLPKILLTCIYLISFHSLAVAVVSDRAE